MHSRLLKEPFIQRRYSGYNESRPSEDIPKSAPNIFSYKAKHFSDSSINHHPTTCACRACKSHYQFTSDELAFSLYGRTVVQPIDTERIQRKRKSSSQWQPALEGKEAAISSGYWPTMLPPKHAMSHKLSNDSTKSNRVDIDPSNAVMSFIQQVQLCMSSLPGYDFGVCARENIPKGTVIGPYSGKRVKPEELKMGNGDCMSFVWEIYKGGKLDHYIDGSDESISCWMRFVRSARNRKEQNLCALQYDENIYYKSLCDISGGTELLVWYEDRYEEYFGIPILLSPEAEKNDRKEKKDHSTQQSTLLQKALSPSTLSTMSKTRLWVNQDLTKKPTKNNSVNIHAQPEYEPQDEEVFSPAMSVTKEHETAKSPDVEETHDYSSEKIQSLIWKCNKCNQTFNQRSSLRMHVCLVKTNQPFDCGHCKLSFSDANKLRTHVMTHANERLFKCGYCERRFAGATTLTNHVRTHTGEKPFVCEKCGKSFSQASQMSRHQRILGDCSN